MEAMSSRNIIYSILHDEGYEFPDIKVTCIEVMIGPDETGHDSSLHKVRTTGLIGILSVQTCDV
jgi:hypothetical protein